LEAIRLGAGDDTFLLACGCPFGPAIGIADAMRIGPDTAPSWEPYFNWLPWITPFIKKEGSPPSLRNALRHTINLDVLHRRWWWNDPDCLLVREDRTSLTPAEVQTAVTLVGLSGGMFVSSDDLSTLSQERLRWISLLVPNLGLHGHSSDLLERELPLSYQVEVHTPCGDYNLLALFNWGDQAADCLADLRSLGFPVGAELVVFDFWNEAYFRTAERELIIPDVPPHGCRLMRICQLTGAPLIIGDTMHISQGAEFIASGMQDGILRLETLDFNRWVSGTLYLSLPAVPTSATCNDEPVPIIHHPGNIYAFQLDFLGFGRIDITF
jgi:alpha-galactosidase